MPRYTYTGTARPRRGSATGVGFPLPAPGGQDYQVFSKHCVGRLYAAKACAEVFRILSIFAMTSVWLGALLYCFLVSGPVPIGHASPMSSEPDVAFPAGSVIDVKKDYGARGDGVADDTQAILSAIRENIGDPRRTIIYFPRGTYLVSDRLEWRDKDGKWQSFLTLQGQNRQETIIKLRDNAPGYNDPSKPKAVIFTAAIFFNSPTAGGKNWTDLGEGNTAFRNYILDLTVDTGSGNPGAIGIDYLASNMGSVRDVTIRSGDGRGSVGLAFTRKWPGPCLIKNVEIEGFDLGISADQSQYNITFEHIALKNQRVAGIRNKDTVLSIRDLKSTNSVPVVQNLGDRGLITLLEGSFDGGSAKVSAIENRAGMLYARNISAAGYKSAIDHKGSTVPGLLSVEEFVSEKVLSLFQTPRKSLHLPIQETPDVPRDPVNQWVSVATFRANGNDNRGFDNTPAFQAAIDSGASTIYVPRGRYLFSDTIRIRGNVRRIDFMGSFIGVTPNNKFDGVKPLFRVEEGVHPVVMIERIGNFWDVGATAFPGMLVEHASPKALVIREGSADTRTLPDSGPLFLEDVGISHGEFKSQNVWARQLNPEGGAPDASFLVNDGGNLWILGLKTEQPRTVIKTVGGGRTELLGALIFPVQPVPPDLPAFINENSSHSLVYLAQAYQPDRDYQVQVRETKGTVTNTLTKADVLPRGAGSVVPLHVGYAGLTPVPPTPTPDAVPQTPGPTASTPPIIATPTPRGGPVPTVRTPPQTLPGGATSPLPITPTTPKPVPPRPAPRGGGCFALASGGIDGSWPLLVVAGLALAGWRRWKVHRV